MPVRTIPHHLGPLELLEFLPKIGLTVPVVATPLAAMGQPLSAAGFNFSVAEVDVALDKHELSTSDRFVVKTALAHHGLLRRGA
jgi:hypothetical protein